MKTEVENGEVRSLRAARCARGSFWLLFTGLVFAHAFRLAAAEGIRVDAAYIADYLVNRSGGVADGEAYLQNVDLTLEADSEALFGVPGGTLFVYLLWNDDTTFSDRYAGDFQIVSNIDAERALRVYELWYDWAPTERLALRFGLYDLNSEFDAIDTAGFFLNSSHGIGAEYGQSGENGPSIFPVTSLAARLQWQVTERTLARYALLDAVPGDPDDSSATVAIELGDGEGVLHALEIDHRFAAGPRLALGGWLYSEEFDRIGAAGASRDDGNGGLYAFADVPVRRADDGGPGVDAFVRYGIADEDFNPLDRYFGAGVVLSGFSARRPDDQIGLAVASARAGDPFRAAGAESHETTWELSYSAPITDWLRLQPDLQYVRNPGLDPALENTLVIGVRVELGAGLDLR